MPLWWFEHFGGHFDYNFQQHSPNKNGCRPPWIQLIPNVGCTPKVAIMWAPFGTKTDHQFLDFHGNSSYFNLLYSSGCKTFGKQTKFVMSTDMAWTQKMFAPFWCFWVRWGDNIELNSKCKLRLLDTVSKHSPDWIRETHDKLQLIKC